MTSSSATAAPTRRSRRGARRSRIITPTASGRWRPNRAATVRWSPPRSTSPRRNGRLCVADRPIHLASPFPEPEVGSHHRLRGRGRRAISRPSARSRPTSTKPSPTMSPSSAKRTQGRPRQLHRRRARTPVRPARGSWPQGPEAGRQLAGGARRKTQPALIVLPLDHGFTAPDVAVLTEQDMLGDRLVRRRKQAQGRRRFPRRAGGAHTRRSRRPRRSWHRPLRRADLDQGRQGAARLRRARICAAATSSTCRSRISTCCRATAATARASTLDRLGGEAWQRRKSRMKERIREIAGELIKTAAIRATRPGVDRRAGRAATRNSSTASPMRRPTTRTGRSRRC